MVFDPRGKVLASAGYDDTVKLWYVSSGELLYTLEGHQDIVYSVAFDPQGEILVHRPNHIDQV